MTPDRRRPPAPSGFFVGVLHALLLSLAAGMLLTLLGCAVMDPVKVEGWPKLAVYEHHVSNEAMRDRCVKYTPMGASPLACAEFNFLERRCDIWFSADFPPSQTIVEHERLHCGGYDHAGESTMHGILERWAGT